MSDIAIRVRNVGKKFAIQQDAKAQYQTLRDQLAKAASAPIRKLKAENKDLPRKNGKAHDEHELWALKDITFDIHRGELVGLIGPNGAGKSTLLKILTRITEPTVGSIDIYGRVGSLLEVGTGFHKELTGRDNVYLNGAILGMKKIEIDRKFDEIVAFAEVEKFIDTPVKYYSSGMTVRLAFAVAAHLEPEILLVDEVLAVGDAAFQKKSLAKMERVGEEGRTVIFVSHHMPSITRLCESALLLKKGQLVESGPVEKVVADYLTSHLGMTAYRDWPDPVIAPGNDIVRLRSVRIIDEEGKTSYSFDIRKSVGVEMCFDVLRPGYALYPHFTLHNEEEVHLFTSIDTDSEWRGKPRPVGRFTSVAWIPGNLLSEGVMSIGPAIRTEMPHIVHYFVPDAVAFQVIDSPDSDTARVDYSGRLQGAVRPYLRWTNQYEPAQVMDMHGSSLYGHH